MRHVDDGALHAWLDGELDAYPPREAAWIREHLEHCSECASRLEAERAVRDEAEAILAGTPVDTGGLPSLEEMRRRARAEDARGGGAGGARVRVRRTAWAASIILAAGAGWMANSLFPRLQEERNPAVQLLGPRDETLVTPEPRPETEADPGASRGEVEEGAGTDESRSPVTGGAEAAEVVAEEVAAEVTAASGEAEQAPPARQATAPGAAPEVGGDPAEKASVPALRIQAPESVSWEPAALIVPGRRARTADSPELPAVSEALGAVALEDAEMGAPGSGLSIPGLEILETSFLSPGDLTSGVLVLQRLPEGDTVAVYHLPAERTPDLLPPLEEGERQWAAPRGGAWVVLRGRLLAETLAELGERLPGR